MTKKEILSSKALPRKQMKKDTLFKESRNSDRGRNSNREERRSGKEADYHRVYVTGLNSAVWPDPPGYHERKMREESQQEKPKKAPIRRPRPHRKTEGATANSK